MKSQHKPSKNCRTFMPSMIRLDPQLQKRWTQIAYEQVRCHRVITVQILKHVLSCSSQAAELIVAKLVREGRVFAHQHNQTQYYSSLPKPLLPDRLREALSVLWFCCVCKPRKTLLSASHLRKLSLPRAPSVSREENFFL